jgi:hypothetical protein
MSTPTITEFLEARIDEDEARASSGWSHLGDSRWETDNYGRDFLTPSAVLAECAAKRAIIHYCAGLGVGRRVDAEVDAQFRSAMWIAVQMAKVYKDHPDYRQSWSL